MVSHVCLSHGAHTTTKVRFIKTLKIQIAWNMIGAVFAAAAPGVPSWSTGFQDGNNMGGLIAAILAPAGGFGKFLLVLIAVSTSAACPPSIYSFGEYSLLDAVFNKHIILQKKIKIKIFNYRFRHFMVVLNLLSYFPLLANSFMAITPFFARVPRYVYTVASTAM